MEYNVVIPKSEYNKFASYKKKYEELLLQKEEFIEKACNWLVEHKDAVETEDNGIAGWIPDYFIDDFRNYMKE